MFFPVGSENSVEFPHACIRGCANNDRHFKLETGRNSPTGSGSLVIDCDDKDVTHHLHETMLRAMQSTKNRDLYLPRSSRNRSQVHYMFVTKVIKHGIPRYFTQLNIGSCVLPSIYRLPYLLYFLSLERVLDSV